MNKREQNSELPWVEMYTDGSCLGNPGPGGWGVLIIKTVNGQTTRSTLSGGYPKTTNNRMELTAAIKGLKKLKKTIGRCRVCIWSDSTYVVNAINKNWLVNWRKNGWKTAARKPVSNSDLWRDLIRIMKSHDVSFSWVKGHFGCKENEICDRLAVKAATSYKKKSRR